MDNLFALACGAPHLRKQCHILEELSGRPRRRRRKGDCKAVKATSRCLSERWCSTGKSQVTNYATWGGVAVVGALWLTQPWGFLAKTLGLEKEEKK
ncbi:hypothetical protein HaLaN_15855 [Haematococcus lacustris]|uniref:Uncharacterized protein n=1 Tax=Haematococcus lacustris TaxID=44745 RepID=A0A699Z9Y3_HAELA|nr:hypothetical protein HaLaN_15855 [Haematococcus lacustris]